MGDSTPRVSGRLRARIRRTAVRRGVPRPASGFVPTTLVGDVTGGIAGAFVALPTMLSCGVVAYSALGPAYGSVGMSAAFATAIVVALTSFVLSGPPLHVNAPKTSLAALLSSLIATGLATPAFLAGLPPDPTSRATGLIALASLAVLLGGAVQLLLAAGRLSRVVRYLPYPVVAGFLNGIAIQIALGQVPHALGLHALSEIGLFLRGGAAVNPWAITLAVMTAALLIFLRRFAPRLPGAIVTLAVGTALYQALRLTVPTADLGAPVGLMPSGMPLHLKLEPLIAVVSSPGFGAVLGPLLVTALTIAAINTVQTAVNLTAGDVLFGEQHRGDKELASQGAGNLLAGLAGGVISGGSMLNTTAAFSNGGRTRVANLMQAATLLAIALLFRPVIALIPFSVMAGVILVTSLGTADRWTQELFQRAVSRSGPFWHSTMAVDIVLVALVTALVVFTSTAMALGVGMAVSSIVFLMRASDGAVARVGHGDLVRSRTVRAQAAAEVLAREGSRIALVELRGALFFGTMPAVEQVVDKELAGAETVILDLHRVQVVDSSGAIALRRLEKMLRRRKVKLLFAHLPHGGTAWHRLEVAGFTASELDARRFDDADRALAFAEDQLLASVGATPETARPLALEDFDATRGLAPADIATLQRYVVTVTAPAGKEIVLEGNTGDSLFLLARGTAAVTTKDGKLRFAGYEAGAAFGEFSLLTGETRSATVRAESDCVLYELARSQLDQFTAETPRGALVLMTNIARLQSYRVRLLNGVVQALSA